MYERIAIKQGAEVLVLGAFGCGAFCNPPEIVAKAFKAVQEKYLGCLDTVEYAVYCGNHETENYDVFHKIMDK